MRRPLIFLAVVSLFLFMRSVAAGTPALTEDDDLAVERMLNILNKPYIKSFKDEFGVLFDCVDIHKQPALDHPLLKNHTIQIAPRSTSAENTGMNPPAAKEPIRLGRQESCPDGTVPIRRTLKQDLATARSAHLGLGRSRPNQDKDSSGGVSGQHFAQLLINSEEGSKFQNAVAVLEILLMDDSNTYYVCVVQAGWHIDPIHEGDGQTRFMTYWTADDYSTTGCLNMRCPGFMLLSQTVSPGMVLPTGNSVRISISKDENGNWVVFLNQERVGYFPKELFVNMMDGATQVQMGGITYAPPYHKSPPMGNGVAPVTDKSSAASTFTHLGVGGANIGKYWLTKDVDDAAIYNVVLISNSSTSSTGNSFQYGGPGGDTYS